MTTYRVELRGDVREVYTIEADSAEDAAAQWQRGRPVPVGSLRHGGPPLEER
jgi:hypothetical protein